MGRDYTTTGGDWAGRQVARQVVCLSDEPGASIYGYRQAMHDIRTQLAIVAAEEMSARSLAAQFALFLGDPATSRRLHAKHTFGQYVSGRIRSRFYPPATARAAINAGSSDSAIVAVIHTAVPASFGNQPEGSLLCARPLPPLY